MQRLWVSTSLSHTATNQVVPVGPTADPTGPLSNGGIANRETPVLGPRIFRQQFQHQGTWPKVTMVEIAKAIYNWLLLLFLVFLVISQLLAVVWTKSVTTNVAVYGQPPGLGTYSIGNKYDEPYSDRVLVCIRRGRHYAAAPLNELYEASTALIEDTTGTAVHGFRVVNRSGLAINRQSINTFSKTCTLIGTTLGSILTSCRALGYTRLVEDNLRIVRGVNSKTVKRLPGTLPVIIMPYWDNALYGRYAIPGYDGSSCMFRLTGTYDGSSTTQGFMYATNRVNRERALINWLATSNGSWRNGWFTSSENTSWNSDIVSTGVSSKYGFSARMFNTSTGHELDCLHSNDCPTTVLQERWGDKFVTSIVSVNMDSITVSNGTRYGLFYLQTSGYDVVSNVYDLGTFISNASLLMLLMRWSAAMWALHYGYYKGVTKWYNSGLGCVANSYSLVILPVTMIPRLKTVVAAFFTVGCEFTGEQRALSDSWFVMYPSIVAVILVYCSLLNLLAKVTRRRMNDWTFAITIFVLSAMHWCRHDIAQSQKFGFDGRLSTVVMSDDIEGATLLDFFKTDLALRLNGNVTLLLQMKLVLICFNLLPLICSKNMSLRCKQSRSHRSCAIEKALAIRACNSGGIGRSGLYETQSESTGSKAPVIMLNAFELIRLGYVVIGDRYLITWESWLVLTSMSTLRKFYQLWNHRVVVFDVLQPAEGDGYTISERPQLYNLNDPRLQGLRWWDIDARPIR